MKHLSFFQRCTAFLIDCTVAVFTFNIVAWVISYLAVILCNQFLFLWTNLWIGIL